jgi:hypothetical protein
MPGADSDWAFMMKLLPLAVAGFLMAMFAMLDSFAPIRFHAVELITHTAASIVPPGPTMIRGSRVRVLTLQFLA